MELLGLQDMTWELMKGGNGYRDRLYWGGISILYNGREDMGVFLDMSSQVISWRPKSSIKFCVLCIFEVMDTQSYKIKFITF